MKTQVERIKWHKISTLLLIDRHKIKPLFYNVNVHYIWHTIRHSSFKAYSGRHAHQFFNFLNPSCMHEKKNPKNNWIRWEITFIDKENKFIVYTYKYNKSTFKSNGFGIYKQRLTRNFERHIYRATRPVIASGEEAQCTN